jgi:two-component system, OmpR family, copper resistance phosphate regulon response regulator CusR
MHRILIAEDEPRIAALLEKGLQTQGFTTTISGDGQEAVDLAQSSNFDLLLLDLDLPSKDGWTVLKELRNQGKSYPSLFLLLVAMPMKKLIVLQ